MTETEENNRIRILVADNEPNTRGSISYNLKKRGHEVYTASTGRIAIKKAFELMPHLIILEVMLPDTDGIEVCKYLRSYPNFEHLIIAFLSDNNEDDTQIAAFKAGGDDYIIKPIQQKVLAAKVRSLLRRSPFAIDGYAGEIRRKNILISKETYTLQYKDKSIELPRKEFELLYLLASRPHKVFTRQDIYDRIWGDNIIVGTRTIDVHIRRLRLRTGLENIKTVKGIGYKFEE
ncbi:MAG: response regulator transcription factor [Bacteroidales bacterium]|jgi:two-component system alkaline phosphatase synthesis response regulator PhoP|nr:response regulator transcription factor [Bacteroidales bacterium]